MKSEKEVIENLKKWLGKDGKEFFTEVKKEHGTLNAVLMENGIPHPVHLREGMQVRNFLRTQEFCNDWNSHDFDDNWIRLVEESLDI